MANFREKSWDEFKATGLLLFLNQFLHIFGWAVVFEYDENDTITRVYPARTRFRGFPTSASDAAYKNISQFMVDNAEELKSETED